MSEGAKIRLEAETQSASQQIQSFFSGLATQGNKFIGLESAALKLGGAIAGAFSVTAIAGFAQATIHAQDAMGKMAQEAGFAVDNFSRLAFATKFSDFSADQLTFAFKGLSEQMTGASQGAEKSIALFTKLQIAFENSDHSLRESNDVLRDIAEKFRKMPDGAEKVTLAVDLFGRGAQKLIPVLNEGTRGIDEWGEKADAVGATISGNTARAADDFGDSLQLLNERFKGVGNAITADVLPGLNAFVKSMDELGTELNVFDDLRLGILVSIDAAKIGFGLLSAITKQFIEGFASSFRVVVSNFQILSKSMAAAGAGFSQFIVGVKSGDIAQVGAAMRAVGSALGEGFDKSLKSFPDELDLFAFNSTKIWTQFTDDSIGVFTKRVVGELGVTGKLASAMGETVKRMETLPGKIATLIVPGELKFRTVQMLQDIEKEYIQAMHGRLAALDLEKAERLTKLRHQVTDVEELLIAEYALDQIYAKKRVDLEADTQRRIQESKLSALGGQRSLIEADRNKTRAEKQREINALAGHEIQIINDLIAAERARAANSNITVEEQIDSRKRLSSLEGQLGQTKGGIINPDSVIDQSRLQFVALMDEMGTVAENTAGLIAAPFKGMFDGLNTGFKGLLHGTLTWKQAILSVGEAMENEVISAISKMFTSWITERAAAAVKNIFFSQAEGKADISAKAPGAAASSISSFGIASIVGIAAFIAAMAAIGGAFEGGGFTGFGPKSQVAGVVHKGEYVIDAANTSRLGISNLDRMTSDAGGGSSAPEISSQRPIALAIVDNRRQAQMWAESEGFHDAVVRVLDRNGVVRA